MKLEICTDASIRAFENRRVFGCAGAICTNTEKEKYVISPDTTSNRSELLAIYLGINMANEIIKENPGLYTDICLYSDSQFSIFGLTKWMGKWIKNSDRSGIFYGSNNKPVKNQEMFKAIITYLYIHNIKIKMYHQSGHVNINNLESLSHANQVFMRSNGFLLPTQDIYRISYYNNIVDKNSRDKLADLNPDDYPVMDYSHNYSEMCGYVIPDNYKEFVI